jgi:hypothetical protein
MLWQEDPCTPGALPLRPLEGTGSPHMKQDAVCPCPSGDTVRVHRQLTVPPQPVALSVASSPVARDILMILVTSVSWSRKCHGKCSYSRKRRLSLSHGDVQEFGLRARSW